MKITRRLAAVGAAAALGVGALAVPVLAQSEIDEDTTLGELREQRDAWKEQRQARFAQELADRLDVPVEDVEAALEDIAAERRAAAEAARDAWLDEQVESGALTREQADALRELEGQAPFGRRGFGRHGHGPHGFSGGLDDATSDGSA